jgi:hypothetical protein
MKCARYYKKEEGYVLGRSGTSFKCRDCNRLDGRILTMKKSQGDEFKKAWDRVSQEDCASFFGEAGALMGQELLEKMQVFVQKTKENSSEVHVGGDCTGPWSTTRTS